MVAQRDTNNFHPSEDDLDQPSHNIFKIAWNHKALVLVGVITGLVLGALFYSQRDPIYQSTTQILVVKKQSNPLPATGVDPRSAMVEDYVATQIVLLRSQFLVEKAVTDEKMVKKWNLLSLPSFASQGNPTGTILNGLTVTRDKEATSTGGPNNIVTLSYRSQVPEDCKTVLTALIDSYQDFLDKTYNDVSKDTIKLIENVSEKLKKDRLENQRKWNEFRQNSPLLFKGKNGINVPQEHLADIEAQKLASEVRRADLVKRLELLKKANKEGHGRVALLALLASAKDEKNPSADSLTEEKLLPLLLDECKLMEDYGEDHPQVQSIRKRIALVRKILNPQPGPDDEAGQKAAKEDETIMANPVTRYMEALELELQHMDGMKEVLEGMKKERQMEAKKLSEKELEEEQLRAETKQLEKLSDVTLMRLKELNLIRDAELDENGTKRGVSEGRDAGAFMAVTLYKPGPGLKVSPLAWQVLPAGCLLGLLAGLGLAYLAELSDKGFRSPEEIRRRLGLTIVGHIPVLQADAAAKEKTAAGLDTLDPYLCVHHRPKSIGAEAYRAVRTALYFSTQGINHSIVQVTSPDMGDGKTTLAANLALAIAQSGKRILLIDADLRRPRVHKLFGASAAKGLVDVLTGQRPWQEVVQESSIPGLSLLPAGAVPANPAELLTSPRFADFLEVVRSEYDFVFLDTPPLLAVTDPCVVASRVDGVLLTLRLSRHCGPQAERAKQILTTLGVKMVGVVVNGVSRNQGHGRYGVGQYEYTYTANEYTSQDYDGEDNYYYEEDDPEAGNATSPTLSSRNGNGVAAGHNHHARDGSSRNGSRGLLGWLQKRWS